MRKTCLVMLLIILFFSFSTAYHAAFALQNKRWCEVDFEELIIWINGKIKLITTYAVYLVLQLDLCATKYFIAICIVIENAILVVQRRIDRSSHRRFSIKKMFLQISQNSQENTCARISPLGDSITGFFLWIFWNLKDHFFIKHLRVTASVFRTMSSIYDRIFLWK